MARRLRPRRTWPQRAVLLLTLLVAGASFTAAGVVWFANDQLSRVQRVDISGATTTVVTAAPLSPGETAPPASVQIGQARVRNYLLVGSDSRDCIDPDSPYAGAFLAEGDLGERSDTMMVLRIDPDQEQAALVSFPRDLWVRIGDSNRKSRINSAYDRDDPTKLVATIQNNFGIPVDHYLEVDFCAFKYLVDAVGGVKVPFVYPTKDRYTGLNIEAPGCYLLSGDQALAYVRSRHYQYLEDGDWKTDGTSDRGRIARQQDFIRRALQRAVDRGATRPDIAKELLDAVLPRVLIDTQLRIADVLAVASKLRGFDPDSILTYRMDGRGTIIGGASVIVPDLTNDSTEAILRVFRGEALLAEAPDPDSLATVPDDPTATAGDPAPTVPGDPVTTTPTVVVEENAVGISPPDDPTCR